MSFNCAARRGNAYALFLLSMFLLCGCNLDRPSQSVQRLELTRILDTARIIPSLTPKPALVLSTGAAPIADVNLTQAVSLPTPAFQPPTAIALPGNTPLPLRIAIDYPAPNTVIAGTAQILGSATHPAFLQFYLEYGNQPNPQTLWYPIGAASGFPLLSGVLGYWHTAGGAVADGNYQVRLRVFLTGGGELTTVVSNIQVRNQIPSTTAPTSTALPQSPVNAVFSLDVDQGFAPLTVRFSGPADASISRYSWDFGDGSKSADANPAHTFTTPGEYTVSLTAGGPSGSASFARSIRVASRAAPVANFDAAPIDGEAPLRVQFSNASSGNISSVRWDFGDGSATSAEQDPRHTFHTVGAFNVELVVTGPGGQSQAVRQIVVSPSRPLAPIASFETAADSGQIPFSLRLTNTSTGDFSSVAWDFDGDGAPDSRERDPLVEYEDAGEYVITLTVAGAGGESRSARTITATDPPAAAIAAFSAQPLTGNAPLTVNFSNDSVGADIGFVWDFDGDGAPDSREVNHAWTYDAPGQYAASLAASGEGGSSTATALIEVLPPLLPPDASFVADRSTGVAPLTVAFTNHSSGDISAHEWDFQTDGQIDSSEFSPIFTFEETGVYLASLHARGPGGSTTFTLEITVTEPPVIVATPTSQIAFVTDRDGNNEIYLMNDDGSAVRNLTNHASNDRHPAWSPDGSKLVFSSRRDEGNFDIYLLEVDTLAVTRLTSDGNNTRPAWSPDGGRIAFSSDRYGGKDIMIMNTDGSGQLQLTVGDSDDDQPAWSPDGLYIAYAAGETNERDIYVIRASDGAAFATLTSDAGDDFLPAWLNDSTRSRLAFTSTREGSQDIYMIDPLTGGDLQRLAGADSNERQPNWSRDGGTLLFVSDRANGGERNIYSKSVGGGDLRRWTPDGSNDREPKWR